MKDQEDKRIQDLLDKGLNIHTNGQEGLENTDEKIYSLLYKALESPPEYPIQGDFAVKVSEKVLPMPQKSTENADAKTLVLVVLSVLGIAAAILWFFGFNIPVVDLKLSSNLLTILSIGVILMIIVQIADQKLVRPRISKLL